jgi:hypothetical protein
LTECDYGMADDATHATCLGHAPSGTCIPVGSMTTAELKERQERWLACYKQRAESRHQRATEKEKRAAAGALGSVPARDAAVVAERAERWATINAVALAAVSVLALALAVVVMAHG